MKHPLVRSLLYGGLACAVLFGVFGWMIAHAGAPTFDRDARIVMYAVAALTGAVALGGVWLWHRMPPEQRGLSPQPASPGSLAALAALLAFSLWNPAHTGVLWWSDVAFAGVMATLLALETRRSLRQRKAGRAT